MSADYRVLALDQRGHGETEWAAPDHYGTSYMVADLEAYVAALGLNRFVLLGLSMGGTVAIHYAGKQPWTNPMGFSKPCVIFWCLEGF